VYLFLAKKTQKNIKHQNARKNKRPIEEYEQYRYYGLRDKARQVDNLCRRGLVKENKGRTDFCKSGDSDAQ
jgi:hypothetical protein